jgi:hypothetical protein
LLVGAAGVFFSGFCYLVVMENGVLVAGVSFSGSY